MCMKSTLGLVLGAGLCLPNFLDAKADEMLEASAAKGPITVDFRIPEVRKLGDISELLPFAYNNDADWRAGGDGSVELASVRIVKCVGDDPTDPDSWVDESAKTLPASSAEGLLTWEPEIVGVYRAELHVGEETRNIVYYDLLNTAGIATAVDIANAEVTLPTSWMQYTGRPIVLSGIRLTVNDRELKENVDYVVEYDHNVEVGRANLIFRGIGDCLGRTEASFEIRGGLPESFVVGDNGNEVGVDMRMDSQIEVETRHDLLPFTWNTSEDFTPNCPWTIGGLPPDANAVATVTLVPMASPDAEPDESAAIVVKSAPGEGVFPCRCRRGLYEARLSVSLDGVPLAGYLSRLIDVKADVGMLIFLK